jgi:hypothetical protein
MIRKCQSCFFLSSFVNEDFMQKNQNVEGGSHANISTPCVTLCHMLSRMDRWTPKDWHYELSSLSTTLVTPVGRVGANLLLT